jgi:hypothetical protein
MNLTQLAAAKNVKLTKPQANLLAKLDSYGVLVPENLPDMISTFNPVSGHREELPTLVAYLVRIVYMLTMSYESSPTYTMTFNGHKVAIGTFDRVKMLVLSLNSKAYSNFID